MLEMRGRSSDPVSAARPASFAVAVLAFGVPLLVGACTDAGQPAEPEVETVAVDPASAVVCEGDVTVETQTDVDAFDCSEVTGNLTIVDESLNPSDPITSLAGMSELTSVAGRMEIIGLQELTNLDGLESLERVEGVRLLIGDNLALTDVGGLSGLERVDQTFNIRFNDVLGDLSGISSLTTIGERLVIWENPELTSLSGLSALESIGEFLNIIEGNESLETIGLTSLTSAGGIFLQDADALRNLDGLENLTNTPLVHIDHLDELRNVDGLSGLQRIEGQLLIVSNQSLEDLDGLSSLESTGEFAVAQNDALTSVDGLSNLRKVNGDFSLIGNPNLTKCACALYPLFTSGTVVGAVSIEENGTGCNAIAEFTRSACIACAFQELTDRITEFEDAGDIKRSHSRALRNKLRATEKQATKGNLDAAFALLDEFDELVSNLEQSGHIHPAVAAVLQEEAEFIRSLLSAADGQ